MKYKIGDVLIPKNDFTMFDKIFFEKNKKYTILNIYKIGIRTSNPPYITYYVLDITINNYHFKEAELTELFYNLKEIRKQKLNNIKAVCIEK